MSAFKPLEWQETSADRGDGSHELSGFEAETPFGTWYLIEIQADCFTVEYDLEEIGRGDTPDIAKEIAQRDFDRRIQSALAVALAQGARDHIEIRDGLTDGYCDIINQTKKTTIGRVNLWNGTAQDLRDILATAPLTPAEKDNLTEADLRQVIANRDALLADYQEVLTDKQRLTRELDIALHGEEGAAKQAGLCDLIQPARQLRATIDLLERNAGIQAKLLADTGRERDQAISQVERENTRPLATIEQLNEVYGSYIINKRQLFNRMSPTAIFAMAVIENFDVRPKVSSTVSASRRPDETGEEYELRRGSMVTSTERRGDGA
jgi:hypothetical protein